MTTWRIPQSCPRPELRPARALLTPTWLVALAVLALNDHLLKGAGVLPGAVTGKLSDFAGMIVAPVLLAAILRVRSRRGLLISHAAVAAVFAGINLSPALADAWAWLMGFVWPWHITVDPTDLIALPALALGWRALVPAMTRPLADFPRLPALTHLAQPAAILVGGFLCIATSRGDDDGGEGWVPPVETGNQDYADFDADVYLHNATDNDIRLRTRPLRPDVQLDCIAVTDDPGLLLSEALFGEGTTATLPPSTNVAARDVTLTADCYAVRVEGDELSAPFILFWQASDVPISFIDGDIDDPDLHTTGAVLIGNDADLGLVVTESRSPVVFPVDDVPPVDAVRPGSDEQRLAWSDPPFGDHRLTAVSLGPDGCVAVTVDDKDARWYVCVPAGAFPFEVDQYVRITDNFGSVEIRRIADPQDPIAVPQLSLTLSHGDELPTIPDLVLAARTDFDVELAPDPICGTVARPYEISARFADNDISKLRAGESHTSVGAAGTLTVWVAHAEDRVVLDPKCAEGPDTLGADIELAALLVPTEP